MGSKKKSSIPLSHLGREEMYEESKNREAVTKSNSNSRSFNLMSMKGYDMPSSLEELLKKKEIRVSSEQKTPFNINRNTILFIYFLLIVLTNRLFFGWPNLSNLLFREDAYIWKCAKNTSGGYDKNDDKRYVCEDQDKAVQTIFIFGSSAYFAFSFFNGIIVDYIGSRFSMLLGHVLNLIGWILLIMSNEHFDAYVVGGVFIAASIDLASFSTLNASGLYPGNENLIVNIISGAGSLSTGTMTILDLLINGLDLNFKTFMLCYMCISVGFFFILTIFLFPKNRYYRQYEFDNYYSNKEIGLNGNDEMEMIKRNGNNDEKAYCAKKSDKHCTEMNNISLQKCVHSDLELNSNSKKDGYTGTNKNSNSSVNKNNGMFNSTSFKDLFNIFTCAHFLCLWVYGPLNAIYNTFYFSVVENILSKDKNDMLGYILPFSFIPCVILGNISDKYGVMVMFSYELIFALSMYLFSYLKSNFSQWISVISNAMYSSCANGQLWTFISFTFSSKYHSTLIGFLNFVCGIVSFVRLLLFEWAKHTNYDFTYINLLIIGFIGVNIGITVILVFIRRTKGYKVVYGDEGSS
ncbi:major facilitator superfamily-related transporter, putative [Plasmodium ovale]|uniref:Transporter, putative n=2 Tax=Plasmodium ovale TaxID=36330 RepID=A0A1A8VVS9_PLAOA|nr:transporter, putative [Plasmodium ovale curtisi]SBS91430.1 transporter, putative [Plasmodium ovale curtisi]SCP04627.1 major facilitator superfamily-related transporter, putative [Plasmodium ovale]